MDKARGDCGDHWALMVLGADDRKPTIYSDLETTRPTVVLDTLNEILRGHGLSACLVKESQANDQAITHSSLLPGAPLLGQLPHTARSLPLTGGRG